MIVWIASFPKSGSTWLRLLFQAYYFGECDEGILCTTGDLKPVYFQNVSPVPLNELSLGDINYLRPAALMQIVATWPVQPVMIKTHHANVYVDEIPTIPSRLTKRAIYIVRDPRDICSSYAHHFDCSVNEAIESMANERKTIEEKGTNFQHVISSWSTHVSSWTRDHSYPVHLVKYEELHKRPGEILAKLLEQMEVPIDSKKIDEAVALADFTRLQEMERTSGFLEAVNDRQFFRSGRVGSWKTDLTVTQARKIEENHREQMKLMGYA